MERKENNQLKKSSLILMTIAGISLFMMLAFFSYSMFGGGKGTYGSFADNWSCPTGYGDLREINDIGYCCENGKKFTYAYVGLGYDFENIERYTCIYENLSEPKTGENAAVRYIGDNYCLSLINSSDCASYNGNMQSNNYCKFKCTFMPTEAQMSSDGKCYLDKTSHKLVWRTTVPDSNDFVAKTEIPESDCSGCYGDYTENPTTHECEPNNSSNATYTFTLKVEESGAKIMCMNGSDTSCAAHVHGSTSYTFESGDWSGTSCSNGTCQIDLSKYWAYIENLSYEFNGWGPKGCSSGRKEIVSYSKDTTYYPCWLKNTVLKVYGINGSSISEGYEEVVCEKQQGSGIYVAKDVNAGTNSNKTFKGWSPNSACTPLSITSKIADLTCENGVYYACWDGGSGSSNECTFKIKIPSGASPSNIWHSSPYTYSGELYLNKDSSTTVGNGGLRKYVIPPTGQCFSDYWTVSGSKNDTYHVSIVESEGDCDIELTPQFQSCSNDGGGNNDGGNNGGGTGNDPTPSSSSSSSSPKPSSASSSSEAEYEELDSPYDKCYNKKWVRVVSCQPDGTGAKCKLSTGETVDKAAVSKAGVTGCDVPKDAFDYPVDGDRCNMATGKIVHIDSCQTKAKVIGAHCKDKDGNYILVDNLAVKENGYCKNDKPSTDNSDDPANQDVDKSVQTGTTAFVLSWIAGIIALVISFYYFRKNYFVKQ